MQDGIAGVVQGQGERQCVPGLLPPQATVFEGADSGACDVEVDADSLTLDDVQADGGVSVDGGGLALDRGALDDPARRRSLPVGFRRGR